MRRPRVCSALLLIFALVPPAQAQPGSNPGGNVSALGRKMPPTTGRAPAAEADKPGIRGTEAARGDPAGGTRPADGAADGKTEETRAREAKEAKARAATEAAMLKAQAAAEARNKAWDSRMRRTMGSICKGC